MKISVSDTLNAIVNYAREEAMRTGSYMIGADHLFLGILRHEENLAAAHLRFLGIDLSDLKGFIDEKVSESRHIPYSDIDSITLSRSAANIINIAVFETTKAGGAVVGQGHGNLRGGVPEGARADIQQAA